MEKIKKTIDKKILIKRVILIVLIVIVSLSSLGYVMFRIDKNRIEHHERPIFAFDLEMPTKCACWGYWYIEYHGLGYKIIVSGYNDYVVFEEEEDFGYKTGTWFMKYKGPTRCRLKREAAEEYNRIHPNAHLEPAEDYDSKKSVDSCGN